VILWPTILEWAPVTSCASFEFRLHVCTRCLEGSSTITEPRSQSFPPGHRVRLVPTSTRDRIMHRTHIYGIRPLALICCQCKRGYPHRESLRGEYILKSRYNVIKMASNSSSTSLWPAAVSLGAKPHWTSDTPMEALLPP
jgi:hypothetical protein